MNFLRGSFIFRGNEFCFTFIFLLAVLTACNDNRDIIPPQILRFQLESKEIQPGEFLVAHVHVRDNEGLNQMRFRIREAFGKTWEAWSEVRVIDLGTNEFLESYQFVLPDSALAGMYELGFQVADFQGNASVDSLLRFFVVRPGMQAEFIEFETIPATNEFNELLLSDQDSLLFSGTVVDNGGLARVLIELRGERGNNLRTVTYPLGDTTLVWDAAHAESIKFDNLNELPVVLQVKAFNRDGHQNRIIYALKFDN